MHVFSARSFWLPVLLATLVAAFFGAVLGRRGRQWERALARQALWEGRLARTKEDDERARAERDALLSSPEAIERVAREEYGFAAPDETVTDFDSTARPLGARLRAEVRVSALDRLLMWRQLPLALPAAVFLVTAFICALLNASSAARGGRVSSSSP